MAHHRDVHTKDICGQETRFILSNERLQERVENVSHEEHIIQALIDRLETDETFWDIGACLGIHTLSVGQYLTDGHVVGFEPMPANRGVLIDNMHVNELDNVSISRNAISNELGSASFSIRESFEAGYGRHSLTAGDYESLDEITVPVTRGDALVGEKYDPPAAVKIDAEGAEPLVIEGMEHILRRDNCHTVIVETHEPNKTQPSYEDFGYSEEEVLDMLRSFGFDVEELHKEYHFIGTKDTAQNQNDEVELSVVQGDIAKQSADVLANAAGTSLRMGSGVAGSLREAGGEQLNIAAVQKGPIPLGSAVLTGGYNLDSDAVVHAATMPHYGDGCANTESIRAATRNMLQVVDDAGHETLAIPALGCGLAGVPVEKGIPVIIEEIRQFTPSSLSEVTLVAYTDESEECMRRSSK